MRGFASQVLSFRQFVLVTLPVELLVIPGSWYLYSTWVKVEDIEAFDSPHERCMGGRRVRPTDWNDDARLVARGMTPSITLALFASAMASLFPLAVWAAGAPGAAQSNSPVAISKAEPPAGLEASGVTWISAATPNLGTFRMAVATPSGRGPFTTLLILHGSHGFAREYVQLAKAFSDRGIQAIAACWFSGSSGGAGSRFVTPVDCSEAPPISMASGEQARKSIDALLEAVRQLATTRADRIALFGHSRGGGAALNYVLRQSGVYAAVLNSTGYPPEVTTAAAQLQAPVLLLHGTADQPAEGGSPMTSIEMARAFEVAARKAGRPIQAHYYEAAHHNEIFTSESQRLDEVQRTVTFLQRPDSAPGSPR